MQRSVSGLALADLRKLVEDRKVKDVHLQGYKDGYRVFFNRTDAEGTFALLASTSGEVRIIANPATLLETVMSVGIVNGVIDNNHWDRENSSYDPLVRHRERRTKARGS